MHPRASLSPTAGNKRAKAILEFVRERGSVHPREVDAHFSHGRVTNYWGGSSSATTHMLELMHYKGLLRVARREAGIRIYAAQQHGPGPDGRGRATRASRSARRCRRRPLRAGARREPVVHRQPAALCDAALARRDQERHSAREAAARPCESSTDTPGIGRRTNRCRIMKSRACGCSRRSIRWSGIGGASKCSGTGPIASRPTRRRRSASMATTRCRCCGAIA